jgi:predicted small lipoprotein YifL
MSAVGPVRPSRRPRSLSSGRPLGGPGGGLLRVTSFSVISNSRHPEERSAGARLEGRTAPARAAISRVLILLVVALALAGCGKKGNPQPPPDEPNTYPRVYPSA